MKYILTLVGGVIVGALIVLLFLGAPRAGSLPGTPVKPPEAGGDPPGTAVVMLDEKFFDAVLGTIFRDLNAPSFPLQLARAEEGGPSSFNLVAWQAGCASTVVLLPEGSNVKTGVRFADGKVTAPLAFSGSYNAFGNCINFKGWAQASLQLRFDQAQQTVYGEINVEGVNLEGAPPIVGGALTLFVQNAINQRVNPIEILRAHQLTLAVPVKASDGTLKAHVKDVRAEVTNGALRLHITYDFNGAKGQT
jgi:hypothetical protein